MANSKIPKVNLGDTVNSIRLRFNQLIDSVGDVTTLTTTAGPVVDAINELDSELGTISSAAMGTTADTVSGAIAELDSRLDSINDTQLTTPQVIATDVDISNTLEVDGFFTARGGVILGNTAGDLIYPYGSFNLDILPATDSAFNLGSDAKRWKNVYTQNVAADSATVTGNLDVQGVTTLDSATVDGTLNVTGAVTITGSVTSSGTAFTIDAENGTADPVTLGDTITFAAGEGIDTTVSDNTITITGEDATTSNKGVASYTSDYFTVTSGEVTLTDSSVPINKLTEKSITIVTSENSPGQTVNLGGSVTLDIIDSTGIQSIIDSNFGDANALSTLLADGSIENVKLENSVITVTDGSTPSDVSLGGTLTFSNVTNETTVAQSGGTVTIGLPDDVTITRDLTINRNLDVGGNFTVSSDLVIAGDQLLKSNFITLLDSNQFNGIPLANDYVAGFRIDRGLQSNILFVYDDSANTFRWYDSDADTGLMNTFYTNANVSGTANEVELTKTNSGVTIGLPNAVTVGSLTVDNTTINNDTVTATAAFEISGSDTVTVTSTDFTVNATGDATIDASGDIILDADGADVLLKDAGTQYGALTNSSGNLVLKSGTTTAVTMSGADVTIAGNLTVSGTTTTVNSETVTIDDNIIVLNNNASGPAAGLPDAGLEIERGNATNAQLQWDESENYWIATNDSAGTTGRVVTNADTGTVTNTMLAGSIANTKLSNSAITINGTSTSLGGTRTLVTDDIAEDGSPTNLWYTSARADSAARHAISVTDTGGDGSLSYDNTTGVFTYTGPSSAEVVGQLSAGEGINLSAGGEISGEDADSNNKGIASFANTDFVVTAGNVTLKDSGVQAIAGGMFSGNTETNITVTYDAGPGKLNVSLDNTAVTADTYGSATAVPVITVDAQGRITAASTSSISTDLTIAADTGSADTVTLGTDTLTFTGGTGIATAVTDNTITINGSNATTSTKGIASFSSDNFDVSSGTVTIKPGGVANDELANSAVTINGTSVSLGGSLDLTGLTNNSGDITLDASGDIILDGDGADVYLKDGGTTYARFNNGGTSTMRLYAGSTLNTTFSNDDITVQGDVTSLSDARTKENILTVENASDLVSQLRGVWYHKIDDPNRKVGVIAQEVEEVLPEVVKTDDNGMKSVDYGKMVGVLIEAIKDLQQEVESLKSKIEE
jgi:hypothetical protein